MKNEQIISKGVYQFSQINNFISVKNYIFMHQNDKICLVLRFSNDTEYSFDSLSFCVIQLNAEGKAIGKTRVEYKNIAFAPGSLFTPESGIAVSGQCVDFKIQFYEANSEYYRYVVRKKRVFVYYDRKKAAELSASPEIPLKESSLHKTVFKEKIYVKTKLISLLSVLVLLFILAANIYYMLGLYTTVFSDRYDKQDNTGTITESDNDYNADYDKDYENITITSTSADHGYIN